MEPKNIFAVSYCDVTATFIIIVLLLFIFNVLMLLFAT